jgi:hypothetical protein
MSMVMNPVATGITFGIGDLLSVVANYMQQELEKDPLDNSSC